MKAQESLLPCPFCGGEAHFEIDSDRWEWIECSSCGMQGNRSASLMEDCKKKLAEAWNRRQPVARTPLSDEKIAGFDRYVAGTVNGRFARAKALVRMAEAAHGITQEQG